ncbi:enoyl-CoA hydratase-related protein [Rhizohabitans arisaemae]|uniref:enoyl-CoA hydratase-related protein n=1 Tax=Rhizohabitans arisaemae TaxID=2720610 RepID=UPI0024B281E3|nr:enoyl-CoA hydratase-related protein [Rhizohabitans arisaemae]
MITEFTIDAPGRANALGPETTARLDRALADAVAQGSAAFVLRAAGGTFCSGFDLGDLPRLGDADLLARFVTIERLLERIRTAPLLTIACVGGPAVGAGADLVAACDYRLGTGAASFAFPGPRFGLLLGTAHLTRLVGGQPARDLLVRRQRVDVEEALRIGLLSHRVDELGPFAAELAAAAAALDPITLRELLAVTRGRATADPLSTLVASAADPGLADRVRAYRGESQMQQLINGVAAAVAEGGGEQAVTGRVAKVLRAALAKGLSLPPGVMVPHPERYVMYPLHVAPDGSFSIASAVWNVGQRTPIHDHGVWGVVGIHSGVEHEVRYAPPAPAGAPRMIDESLWRPGEVTVCCTTDQDLHQVASGSDEPCVGIHVYGGDIGTIQRRSYHPETGEVGYFTSAWTTPAS